MRVCGDNGKVFTLRLCDQDPVEWVPMMERQKGDSFAVFRPHREPRDAVVPHLPFENCCPVRLKLELAKADLDGDFKNHGGGARQAVAD